MQSIFLNALSEAVAKHIDLSALRRETLSWLALLIMQHGTIRLWRLAAYVASSAQQRHEAPQRFRRLVRVVLEVRQIVAKFFRDISSFSVTASFNLVPREYPA